VFTQLRSFCIAAIALLVMSGCAPVAIEEGAVEEGAIAESVIVLEPKRTATYTLMEWGDDIVCGFDRAPFPLTVREDDLQTGEVGAGFRNWFRHEDQCRRRYTWIHQAFVEFDTQPLRDLGRATAIRSATLRFHERPLSAGQPPQLVRSVADGLSSTNCPMLRAPAESWERGWHDVRARADLIETGRFPFTRTVSLGLPGINNREIDVTKFVQRLVPRPERPFELGFESVSDLFYQNNNEFCMEILGGFSVAIEYEKIGSAEP
jgi:hypothetical protein